MTMPRGYDESYLEDFRCNLGNAFEYAALDCGANLDEFFHAFITTGIARRVETGDPRYLVGYSGFELVGMAVSASGLRTGNLPDPTLRESRSPEYWAGWILAYYQWFRAERFCDLERGGLTPSVVRGMYLLHEAGEEKFVESADALLAKNRLGRPTRLGALRRGRGMTQRQLAEAAGVSLRMVQLYEQRQNDIMRAEFATAQRLARALGCAIDDLAEPPVYVEGCQFNDIERAARSACSPPPDAAI